MIARRGASAISHAVAGESIHVTAVAAASQPFTSSVAPGRSLSFFRRLFTAIVSFIVKRLKRVPIVVSAVEQIRAIIHMYSDPTFTTSGDSIVARCLDGILHAARLVRKLIGDFISFTNWTLNPVLFLRRLYRMCCGLIVLYALHVLASYFFDAVRRFTDWFKIERGLWNGDTKCVRKRELDTMLATAQNYEEWKCAAMALDELEQERIAWKNTTASSQYQWRRIAKNVESIRSLIRTHKAQQAAEKLLEKGSLAPVDSLNAPPHPSPFVLSPAQQQLQQNSGSPSAATVAERLIPVQSPRSDPHALMRFLRSRLFRNIGNITNANLYFDEQRDHFSSSFPDPPEEGKEKERDVPPSSAPLPVRVGTKALIESYHNEVIHGFETILADPNIPAQTKLSFFRETRHAYGRSALLLNGGSNLGLLHLGVVKALLEIDVLPQIISGSSVGAIFAALICSRTDEELAKIGSKDFLSLEFPSVQGSLRRKLRRFLEEGILMDISALIHCVRSHIGDLTFEQAYLRYGRILNIVVTPIHMAGKKGAGEEQAHSSEPILLNYLTTPSVLIWSAACASCAVPHLYAPVELLAKNPQGEIIPYLNDPHDEKMRFAAGCVDGTVVKMDVAMDRLRTLFNCNNFIISQLNLSLLPFIFGGASFSSASPLQKLVRYLAREVYQRVTNLCCLFGITTDNLLAAKLGRYNLVRILLYIHSLTSQQIKGDITIVVPVSWRDYSQLLENPSTKRLNQCVDVARRYTWTKGSLIKAHCIVEFALDRCVRKVRESIGVAANQATAAAFAHPNRAYSALGGGGQSPYINQSPSLTPQPQTLYWSKKLNARALQPSRKASFTSDTPAGLPALDLGVGRHSPGPAPRPLSMQGLNYPMPTVPSPFANSMFPSSTTPSHGGAPRHRSNSNVSSPSAANHAERTMQSPMSPPTRQSQVVASAGIDFVGGSMRPPPSFALTSLSTRLSRLHAAERGDSQPTSPRSAAGSSGASSANSTAPSSPVPADSSRDDLKEEAEKDKDASHVEESPPSSSVSGPASALHSQPISALSLARERSRARLEERASGEMREFGEKQLKLSSPAISPAVAPIEGGDNLLRSVPSVSGRSPLSSPTVGMTLPHSKPSSSQHLQTTSSSGNRIGDSFNSGVMSHLAQQMTFALPNSRKAAKKSSAAQHSAKTSTTIEARDFTIATTSGSESSSGSSDDVHEVNDKKPALEM